MIREIQNELSQYIKPERAAHAPRYFKAGPGEYGEGDKFLGIAVPDCRKVARNYLNSIDLPTLQGLFDSDWHEERLTGIFILTALYKKSKKYGDQESWLDFYLKQVKNNRVNNWDLIDSSAHHILGDYLTDKPKQMEILYQLAESGKLWSERCAVIATLAFIRNNQFEPTLDLCTYFLNHPHDLMHKACGWMLREAGQKSPQVLYRFLDQYATVMPRTMLRYAIEKLPQDLRSNYMGRKNDFSQ